MPINTDLNIAPYFDDFDVEKQFYKILFKPAYAVQARELTQLQTILQNQVEQFGDNIYQEGSIIKGCNFTTIGNLQFVKLVSPTGFDVDSFVSGKETDIIGGIETEVDVVYELEGLTNGLKANIIAAARGFETRPPDLNTFFINYLNTNTDTNSNVVKTFQPGESLQITRYKYNGKELYSTESQLVLYTNTQGDQTTISVTQQSNPTGKSYGIRASAGIIFQKGHFLFTTDQTLIVSKYDDQPDGLSVGYKIVESTVSALQDNSLYDNANGSQNENAPGADRLQMIPVLTVVPTGTGNEDSAFFALIRYENGNKVQIRDVSQFNVIGDEMARRTYEESGNYVLDKFKINLERRNDQLEALLGTGTAYVKGYRVENVGVRSFVIDNVSNTAIQENQATTIDYGNYVDIVNISGRVDIGYEQVTLQNASSGNIGVAYVRNITPTRLYLYGIKMTGSNRFDEVVRVVGYTGVITVSANTRVKEANRAPIVFETGTPYMKEMTDISLPVRAQKDVSVASDTIIIDADPGEDFGLNQDDIVVIDASNTQIPVTGVVKSSNNTRLTVSLLASANSDATATIYFNKRITSATSHSKAVVEPYVKVTFASATSQYSLGFPDVFEIQSVTNGVGGDEWKDSFVLKTNQTDHFYDISYMEYIPGRPKPPNGELIVKLKVFQTNTSTGQYFFNINSYPIDDTSDVLPADKIRSYDLDTYRSPNGKTYNLRNCIDFRPHVDPDPVCSYSDTNISAAGVITNAVGAVTRSFTQPNYLVPALQSNAVSDIEAYLARVDAIAIDSYGSSTIIKGEEAENPVTPKVGADELVVATVYIPGYPALSQKEASESGKFSSAVQVKQLGTKNYTMRDIEKLEQRIEGMEYYISLNQLEQETENLTILDENGLTRFKNGYVVDPFNDAGIANAEDPNYKAAIHFNRSVLTPALNTFPLDLKYKSGSGASIFPSTNAPEIASLSRDANIQLIGQPFATNFRNCVSNFWSYNGNAEISPSHDMAHDTVQNPVPAEIDLVSVFQDLQETWPLTDTQWGDITLGQVSSSRNGRTTNFTQPRTQAGVISSLAVNDGGTNTVGDFVTNVDFQPFMRSRDIKIYVSGLRPNTQHYFFFDGKDVNAYVAPGNAVDSARDVAKFGDLGAAVSTDSNGVLRAVFALPAGEFFVGDRELLIVDVDQLASLESGSTSRATIVYHAYNISQTKTQLSTRIPEFDIEQTATNRNLAARTWSVTRGGDPLAQTFFIKQGMGRGSNTVFASKIDLYFKRKSDINGVTVMLREVVNGYPSPSILPFSKTHLLPTQVNTSDDASAVTEVFFEAPVRLETEKEYAIVIMPDANDPNYLHFTSKVGGTDLTPGNTQGTAVSADWGDGVLFTSTNNKAWQSVQDEDIKFNLYRHDFNASTGSVTLTNDDHEFFTLSDWDGRFNSNEIVYKETDTGTAVSMIYGTSIITGTGFGTAYSAGDYILVRNASNKKDIFRIASVDSNTQMTTDKPCSFSGANSTGTPVVIGTISHYNSFNRAEMHLRGSSATTSKFFEAGDTVIGLDSGTEGTIGTINNINLSYVQPLIQKTNDSVTTTTINGTFVDPENTNNTYDMPMKFGDNNNFTRKGVVVYSKSNNLNGTKVFDITVSMANRSNPTSSPMVDLGLSALLAYQYKITNASDTTSKYISKSITLAEDLDAEDMNLYLTAFRPNGTDIKVYIRPQHPQDATPFDAIPWIELELYEGVNTYSSTSNVNDFREFRYRVASTNKDGNGIIEYISEGGTFSGYRTFAIKIEMRSENIHNAPIVKDYRGIALT